jgi:mono/diheme cytochrome c family protein
VALGAAGEIVPMVATTSRLALLLAALLTVAGCGGAAVASRERLSRGHELYLTHCSRCHQPDGMGYAQVFPNLAGNPIVQDANPEPVIEIVTHGRADMPSFDERRPDELADIVTYVRHAWGNNASAVTPAEVK